MQALTERSALLIRIMFEEPEIMNSIIDGRDSNLFSRIDINPETCRIVLGKTRCNWWNHLTGDIKEISLEEFAFKTIGVLASKANREQRGDLISEGLLKDTADALQREGRSNDIIDRLFLVGYMGVKTTWSCLSLGVHGAQDINTKPIRLNVRANDRMKTFELPGSGDPIINVVTGITDIQFLGDLYQEILSQE